ncbi:MAG: hypothetical protein ACOC7S_02865 [Planctomycetota bacterium]
MGEGTLVDAAVSVCRIPLSTPLAYVGPGAAISLLGALLAILGAIFLIVFGALLWPLRALWRKVRGHPDKHGAPAVADDGGEPAAGEED